MAKYQYKQDYDKNNYKRINLKIRDTEYKIIEEYAQNLDLSKNALLIKCALYCYHNYIDVTSVKISKPAAAPDHD